MRQSSWTSSSTISQFVLLLSFALLLSAAACAGSSQDDDNDAPPTDELPAVTLTSLVSGLSSPLDLQDPRDGSGRLFVVEQAGRVRIIQNGILLSTPFLDISSKLLSGGERGLLGLVFHPSFPQNPRFYVNYTREPDGATVIAEYRVSGNANIADTTERQLLVVSQPYANHNGGQLAFGTDGFLYIGLGDGGGGGLDNAQNRNVLLGKMLRIDVNTTSAGKQYGIPSDNPFLDGSGAPEVWAYGLRNPWRFSFDRQTSRLFVADVGQSAWEEINLLERAGNYGWNTMEGAHCYEPAQGCNMTGLRLPIAEYGRSEGQAVTGGYVYRGSALPGLAGAYVFGDFLSGTIWVLQPDGFNWRRRQLLTTTRRISSFGQDSAGEIYIVDHSGSILRLRPQ
ncbi:MAG: sorbosone dehydrogenase family protein [Candidatus Korobacteraceae bacterium]